MEKFNTNDIYCVENNISLLDESAKNASFKNVLNEDSSIFFNTNPDEGLKILRFIFVCLYL